MDRLGREGRAADPGDMNSDSGLILRLVKCLPPQSTAQLASLADFFRRFHSVLHIFSLQRSLVSG